MKRCFGMAGAGLLCAQEVSSEKLPPSKKRRPR